MSAETLELVLTLISVGLLSFVLPVAILFSRDNVKARRQEIIRLLEGFFRETPTKDRWSVLPSFEFVKSKYLLGENGARANEFELHWFSMAVLVFVLISMLGFITAFMVASSACFTGDGGGCLFGTKTRDLPLFLGNGEPQHARQALTIMALAFMGAYIASIRVLLRSVANFDLSPLTFFRCSAGILFATFTAGALWRGMPQLAETPAATEPAWLLFAFTLGLYPGLPERMVRALWRHGNVKRMDEAATDRTRVVPLELIDGIDGDARTRLEDFNLYDVQNLATANPIQLFVETPFGIYQSIDWVAQAQLAAAFGVERFLALRSVGVRTIFDLETILLSRNVQPGILEQRIAEILLPGARAGVDDATDAGRVVAARRLAYAAVDDLSTRRLRQMWRVIERNLGEFGPDTIDDPPHPSPPRFGALAARVSGGARRTIHPSGDGHSARDMVQASAAK